MDVTLQDAKILCELGKISNQEFEAYADLKLAAIRTALYGENTRNLDYSELLSENDKYANADIKMM